MPPPPGGQPRDAEMLVNPVERPALAQGFGIGQPDLGLAHARERRPGQGVEGAAAAQRRTTAKPLLASVVQAVLDDTHRAAMRAPARAGKIDDLFPDQRFQRLARRGRPRQPFNPHALFGRHRMPDRSFNRTQGQVVHARPPMTDIF